ncbi:acetylcholine receptor subunit alpha-like [Glandiceps talaboti]
MDKVLAMHHHTCVPWISVLVIVLASTCNTFEGVFCSEAERALQHDIFVGYDKAVRPVVKPCDPLNMSFGLSITQLHYLDEKNQIMALGVWMTQEWTDFRLTWNPMNYSGVDTLVIAFEKLWYPDMVLYSSADGKYDLPKSLNARLTSDGVIRAAPPAVLVSPCVINIRFFPFDVQRCSLKIGTWEYNGNETILKPKQDFVVKEDFLRNVEWEMIDSHVEDLLIKYPCCPYVYSNIVYTLVLKRRPLYYITNIIIPCVFMSFITLSVFYLPPDSGEKITLSISILLALSVLHLLVADIMPPTSETTPLISKYLLFCMSIVMSSIIITIIVLNVHHRTPSMHRMPGWVRKLFIGVLPTYLFMSAPRRCTSQDKNGNSKENEELFELSTFDKDFRDEFLQVKCEKFRRRRKRSLRSEQKTPQNLKWFPNGGLKQTNGSSFSKTPLLTKRETVNPRCFEKPSSLEQSNYQKGTKDDSERSRRRTQSCCSHGERSQSGTQIPINSVSTPWSLDGELDDYFALTDEKMRTDQDFQHDLLENVEVIANYVRRERQEYNVKEEWKFVAMVIDRILLIAFIVTFFLGSFILMLTITGIVADDKTI